MFMNMMSACNRIPWVLLFLELLLPPGQASVIVRCPTFRYMLNGTCYLCPDNCRVCVSDTNCSLCTRGFFGPVCENRCGKKCTGTCHKSFGHCTYGCPDGEYPAGENGCKMCPQYCSLCESESKCVMCEDGYFGEICQKGCPDHCTTCNKTTGQCLQCNDSYFLLDGLCKSCPYGCRLCITEEKCQSCEDGFQGPFHDRCLYKCPTNGVSTYNVPYEDGRCGIWQHTTTNICHLQSESHSCTSSGICLQDIRCPDSVQCVDETYVQAACATVMHYDCKHTCKQLVSLYGCEANCTVQVRDNGDNNLLCMTDSGSIDANMFQNTTEAHCKQQQDTPTDSTSWSTDRILLVVCAIVCAITICSLIVLLTFRRGLTKRNESKEEDSKLNEFTRPHNWTHLQSAARSGDEKTTEPMLKNAPNSSTDEGFDRSRQQSRSQSVSTTVCFLQGVFPCTNHTDHLQKTNFTGYMNEK